MKWLFTREKTTALRMAEVSFARLSAIRKQLRKDLKELKRVEKNAKVLLERLRFIAETTADDIEDCEKRIAFSEKALEALRSEHEVDAEAVIPLLMKRLKQVEAKSEAEIAISNHRRAGATPPPFDREL